MKKKVLTIAIVLGMTLTGLAQQNGGGLFRRGDEPDYASTYSNRDVAAPLLLPSHGESGDQNGNQTTPVGTGIAVLTALGGAYLVAKRRKED